MRINRAHCLLLLLVNGCITDWEPQPVAPAQVLSSSGESSVQVRLASGTKVVLMDPAIEGDSLVGWLKQDFDDQRPPARRAFALADVKAIAVRKNNFGANVVLGVVAGAALWFASVVGIYAVACANQGCD